MASAHFGKVTLIGVGLLGGSLGKALRRHRLASVHGWVRRVDAVQDCLESGAVDHATTDITEAVRDAGIVVLGLPVGVLADVLAKALPGLPPNAVVTDVGSVKGAANAELESMCQRAGARWIGGHPMAGSEQSGVRAAREDLFHGALCLVTPTRHSDSTALQLVESLWKSVGGRVLRISPEQHDLDVAWASHLPHLVATALTRAVLNPTRSPEVANIAASGFRDTTRIASGSPEMWRDIAIANSEAIREALAGYRSELERIERLLSDRNAEALLHCFQEAKRARDAWKSDPSSTGRR